jgi:phage terminase large subunit
MMEVDYYPLSDKYEGLWMPTNIYELKIIEGGRGGGKSEHTAEYVIIRGSSEKINIFCLREFQSSIAMSSKPLLERKIRELGLSEFWQILETELRCVNGTIIKFMGMARNIQNLKGLDNASLVWIEEAEATSQESLDFVLPSVRGKDQNGVLNCETIITFNPRYATDPVAKLSMNPPEKSWTQKISWRDNPKFPENLRRLKDRDEQDDYEKYLWVWEGEYIASDQRSFISSTHVAMARNRTPIFDKSSPIIGGLDVARFGGDRIALVVRQGAIILAVEIIEKADTIDLSDWAVEMIIKHKIEFLSIDSAGSAGVYDLVKSMSDVEVYAYNGGHSAEQADKYRNCRAESWGRVKDWFKNEGAIDKSDYWDEATRVLFKYDEQNRVQLESKEIMRSRGVKSPDIIDALSMTFINIFGRSKTREKLKALRRSR